MSRIGTFDLPTISLTRRTKFHNISVYTVWSTLIVVCWMWRLRVGYVDWRTGPSWAQTMHTWKPYTSADISAATSPMTPTRKLNFVCKPRRQPRLKVASLNDTLSGSLCDYRRPLVHFPTAVRPQDVTPANIRPQGVTHSNCQRDICLRSVGLTGYSKHLIRVAVRNPKPHIASHMSLDGLLGGERREGTRLRISALLVLH